MHHVQSSHWLSVIIHVFLNDLSDHFQFGFVKTMTQGLQTVWNSETSISYFQYLIFSGYSLGHCDDEIVLAFILQGDQIRGK